ncbi:hypothetical protein ACWEWI_20470 [Streptomyces sp. NPDC003753]|uniref:hypothetical protein n=1 Tax=unclassified Streptomyces TaxID=2593676 RepID=UPI0019051D63|nr:hypothetical protein [Streptomyces sp. Y2F8-2]
MSSPAARTAPDLTADIPLADPADCHRILHRHPELSRRGHRTAGKPADRLRAARVRDDRVGGAGPLAGGML